MEKLHHCNHCFAGTDGFVMACLLQTALVLLKANYMTIILILAGLICFWLFYKSIDFFDKI